MLRKLQVPLGSIIIMLMIRRDSEFEVYRLTLRRFVQVWNRFLANNDRWSLIDSCYDLNDFSLYERNVVLQARPLSFVFLYDVWPIRGKDLFINVILWFYIHARCKHLLEYEARAATSDIRIIRTLMCRVYAFPNPALCRLRLKVIWQRFLRKTT